MNWNELSFIILSFLSFKFHSVNCNPKVCLKNQGCIEGIFMPGYKSEKFEAFIGIPFAEPPVGELRLKAPKPAKPWNGTINTKIPKPDCIQKNYLFPSHPVIGEEDCLYLNVYRPQKKSSHDTAVGQQPVMVYIYGGGFFSGSTSPLLYGPEYFMDTGDVILVIIAYRLGPFGFLSTGDDVISGNFGLKDQNLALKWVQQYIADFGGDPNSVTIFGQSAGAVAVHLHILSDASKGLFHRAISISGTGLAPFATPLANPLKQARQVAELCGVSNAQDLNSTVLADKLRSLDARNLLDSGDDLKYWDVDPMINFLPVIESPHPDAFLTQDPIDIITSGNYTKIPWVNGLVPNEGAVRALAIFENTTLRNQFNEKFDYYLEKLMQLPLFSPEKLSNKMDRIIDYYFNGTHALTDNTIQGFFDVLTDRAFSHPLYKIIKSYDKYENVQKNPIFLYKFNYRGPYSYSQLFSGGILKNYGVVHCDDLLYLFRSPMLFPDFEKNSTDASVIRTFVGKFVQFASSGRNHFQRCNKKNFKARNTCGFTTIFNRGDSFRVRTKNSFKINNMKFWEELLTF